MSKLITKSRILNEITSAVSPNSITPNIVGSIINEVIDLIAEQIAVEKKFNSYLYWVTSSGSSGSLIVGYTYVIQTLKGSDNFTNCGFVALNVPFVATSTTPTSWTSLTYVQGGKITSSEILKNTINNDLSIDVDFLQYQIVIRSLSGAFTQNRFTGVNYNTSGSIYFVQWISANEVRYSSQDVKRNNISLEIL